MNPNGGPIKPRVCTCCGKSKKTSDFSWNQRRHDYIKTCKECGQWLFLLRKVFGKTRDWERNRAEQSKRQFEYAAIRRHAASTPLAVTLQNAWR